MLNNTVKQRLAKGQPTVGQWISFPSPAIAELVASFQPDWLVLDTEHTPTDAETIEHMLRAMGGTDVVPLVRVAANDVALIKKALDRGAYGAVVPLVNTQEQAQAAVAAAKYPPEGIRGVAGTRASRYGMDLPDYFARWNSQVMVICQIETAEALENVDAIAAVPGVDVLFIGPNDLSANLNLFRQFEHPEFRSAVDRILSAASHHGIAAGYMATTADEVLARVDQGFRFVSAGSDTRQMAAAAGAAYTTIKKGLAERTKAAR
ncbi:MAG: HpcH/HpaI aldolase family protein [bacterium]